MWEKSKNESAASSASASYAESRGEGYAIVEASSYRRLRYGELASGWHFWRAIPDTIVKNMNLVIRVAKIFWRQILAVFLRALPIDQAESMTRVAYFLFSEKMASRRNSLQSLFYRHCSR